jgi:hypothetical protein
MNRRILWAPLLLLVAAGLLPADGDPRKEAEGDLLLRFHDGSILKKVAIPEHLTVSTKFGKVTIDSKEIRRIEVGLHVSDEMTRKIDDALVRLQGNNFKAREAAAKDLLALGRFAYPSLVKLSRGSGLDTTRRVEALLKQLRERLPAYQLKMKHEDVIHSGDSQVTGRIEGPIAVRTTQFGAVKLNLDELQSIRSMTDVTETALTVDAAKYCAPYATWMDTGIAIEAHSGVRVTAAGQVRLGPGQQPSGPDGIANLGMGGPFLPGQLIGKIGVEGTPFGIGQRFEGTPTTEGKLYLHICPPNQRPQGQEDLKEVMGLMERGPVCPNCGRANCPSLRFKVACLGMRGRMEQQKPDLKEILFRAATGSYTVKVTTGG